MQVSYLWVILKHIFENVYFNSFWTKKAVSTYESSIISIFAEGDLFNLTLTYIYLS